MTDGSYACDLELDLAEDLEKLNHYVVHLQQCTSICQLYANKEIIDGAPG